MKHKQNQEHPEKPLAALGEFVRSRRRAKGWSLTDAEAASDVDRTYWSKLELGVFKQPDPRYLARIADALDAPLEDIYGLAGYTTAERLPGFRPYLRSKYHLPPEAIDQLESYFAFLRNHYGVPKDQPVFPRKGRTPKPAEPPASREPEGGPWEDPDLGHDLPSARRAA